MIGGVFLAEVRKAANPDTPYQHVLKDLHKEVKTPVNVAFPEVHVNYPDKGCRSFRCCMCGTKYVTQSKNFPSGGQSILWKGNNGYLPFCKNCCETMFIMFTREYGGNEEHALRHMCAMFDWFYSPIASGMTLTQTHNTTGRINTYPAKMNTSQVVKKGVTFYDTLRMEQEERERGENVIQVVDETPDDEQEDEEFAVTKDMVRTWGRGYKPHEYEFLEDEYADWCNKTEVKSKSQEELVRSICIAQLNIRIAQASGGKVDAAMKTLTDLMASCNLTPRQRSEQSNLTETQLCYGQFIKRIEDEMPIGEPQAEFRDPDGVRKYINSFFFGHMAKALGVRNDSAKEYEEEMKKYAVEDATTSASVNADQVFGNLQQEDDKAGDSDASS